MGLSPLAGKPAKPSMLVNIPRLMTAYYTRQPDPSVPGWFAARPSGTGNLYKLYAESFTGEHHLERILEEAQALIRSMLAGKSGVS